MDILSATILLFLILDPLGNIPIFLTHLEKVENRFRVLARELLLALAILFLFLFFGKQMLDFLHLEQVSVSLAGAIILFIIALRMIFPASRQYGDEEEADETPINLMCWQSPYSSLGPCLPSFYFPPLRCRNTSARMA